MNPYRSELTAQFLNMYRKLPPDVRQRARQTYQAWRLNPGLASLNFKRLQTTIPLVSVRVDVSYRVIGTIQESIIKWDFIGNHDAYMRYLHSR